ncbi:substrate-specific component BioY of biotin ECF transporter [Halalkalibacter wakoensis JCM 9140]|uniref:Biotin transporter n=1 Tax=Halalkalibacter wakoensis JCM 9140 TaxID=1236970 RepID=W4Q8G4_9BACI|nr:biotin transporter BioY [Halalkalibacter wakoensis]GAE28356.1 substrate-specific component BioY of biotin ECF transporter [Halalkalibacter wakoensis JCM 9140]
MSTVKRRIQTVDLVLVAMFAALMAIGANLTSFLVIGSVPITMQTLFAILAGALLGSKMGSLAMIIYLLIGLVGFPVFAQFSGGLRTLVSPTFGFLLSFIMVAFVTGLIIEKSKRKTLATFLVACFVGLIINYVVGTHYMYYAFQFLTGLEAVSYQVVWAWMAAPAVKDIILTFFAAVLSSRIYFAVNQRRGKSFSNQVA